MILRALHRVLTAIGIFLLFGAGVASLAAATLLWPGTALDRIWDLNPHAYIQLAPFGRVVGIAFSFLAVVLAVAARGWFKRRFWGWGLTVAVVATQLLGDLVNIFLGRTLEGGVGIAIGGALLFYLLRPTTRAAFEHLNIDSELPHDKTQRLP